MGLSWLLTNLGFVLGALLTLVVIVHILRRKPSPSGTVPWLLVIVLLPYVGVPLYLIFGGRKIRRAVRRKEDVELLERGARPLAEATAIDRLLRTYGVPGATVGNRLTLCNTGEEAYGRLVELIDNASRRLFVATYLFKPDEVGGDILQRLARRAAQGVQVRLLLDDVGSLHTTRRFLRPLTSAGGRVAFFMPILHLPFRGQTNLRNHRKIVVADGQVAMAGGANIASENIGPSPTTSRWLDLSFVLRGPAVWHYDDLFRSDWQFASGESIPIDPDTAPLPADPSEDALVQVAPSGPDVPGDPLYDAILSAVFAAKRRLWIVTPYFVVDQTLARALKLAVRRGVDLRIFLPEKTDQWLPHLARGPHLRDIEAAGGIIQLYTGSMLHAKVIVMDEGLAIVGSANMDLRSLFLAYEVSAFVYSEREVRAISDWVETLIPVSRTGVPSVGVVRDLCEGLVKVIAPLL